MAFGRPMSVNDEEESMDANTEAALYQAYVEERTG